MQDLLLQTLHELAPGGEPVARARPAQRRDPRRSGLGRAGTALGDAAGPGLVRLACDDAGRWTAHLTPAGREAAQQLPLTP
ncbi:MAG: hypothetical protein ACK44A_11870 [Roseateles sp.]